MINLKSINIEYIVCALFGIVALILSLLLGAFSGNSIALIFQRAFINAILFSILGFVSIFVIKKYVPEIYQFISSGSNNEGLEINAEIPVDKEDSTDISDEEKKSELSDSSESGSNIKMSREDKELENEFNTIDEQTDDNYSLNTQQSDLDLISKDANKDKKFKYEPTIAAQAIRTMMKRDE